MRAMLLQHSLAINKSIIRRLIDVSVHLELNDADGAIELISDLEFEITKLQFLMRLIENDLNPKEN
jgi:hypothetical protein